MGDNRQADVAGKLLGVTPWRLESFTVRRSKQLPSKQLFAGANVVGRNWAFRSLKRDKRRLSIWVGYLLLKSRKNGLQSTRERSPWLGLRIRFGFCSDDCAEA
ncbi:MAG: hypothetical protein A3H57_02000 [Candidatus Taylorbacteria bacterium RIFCSPLOWO2_02_FULL_43_11]|uniref:Uncharacterized protein n=1 Tax=Candidatus Taylorbacteria bacterium RIFCSPHIGHO2_02_FULL_43_32b TaxID=1802306 RepID=A0A1G2MHY1_9BACT|nr:MAG: hypothetical protein A3C72_00685 [Candidatus Taylorbacteria bacterium RIFCSPHIGHO2_02_FULL_43_32b]OHA29518.1 MAG: hypothetical protein A3B08_01740 [Candidatus Taylorbacteria bacterium RIFCSPLOWO2_01_FULL_43_44]OHA37450.1 MAG: hypothetical protein A3H57_02000 [Candidatus Taylorbacteria bacterium RIFCSPLOWO2_02_FULL_43_11]